MGLIAGRHVPLDVDLIARRFWDEVMAWHEHGCWPGRRFCACNGAEAVRLSGAIDGAVRYTSDEEMERASGARRGGIYH